MGGCVAHPGCEAAGWLWADPGTTHDWAKRNLREVQRRARALVAYAGRYGKKFAEVAGNRTEFDE